jgi:hypothetical protein
MQVQRILLISFLPLVITADDGCTKISPCVSQQYSVPNFDGSTGVGSIASFNLFSSQISILVPPFLNVTQGCVVGGSTATLTMNDTLSDTIYACQYENNGNTILPNNQPNCPAINDPSLVPFLSYALQSCTPALQSDQVVEPADIILNIPASNNYPQTTIQVMVQLGQVSTQEQKCYIDSLLTGEVQTICSTATTNVTSAPTTSNGVPLTATMIAVVSGVCVFVCFFCLVCYMIYRRRSIAKQNKSKVEESQDISLYDTGQSDLELQNRRDTIDSRRMSLLKYTRTSSANESINRSRVASISTNLADQTLCNGFLKLDYNKDLREIEILNEGGAAIVYLSELLNESISAKFGLIQVAVKVPKIVHSWTDEQAKACFTQEVSVIWSLNSCPFIVQLLGYSIEPMALVTRCYDCNLQEYLNDQNQPLTPTINFKFSYEIGEAIKAVHAVGIAHRDIKSGMRLSCYLSAKILMPSSQHFAEIAFLC